MTTTAAMDVRAFLLAQYAEPLAKHGVSTEQVSDGFDLLREGIIDSLGILDMVAALEERFGMTIDFENMEAEQLTRVGALSRYVEAAIRCKT